MDVDAQWKAKVLEVRALDPEHVYIRVAWLNRPEDLDSGRKPYHGKDELIPTNQIDIIDAMAVNGAFEVSKWEESADEDESSMPAEDQYFWRQTYDQANTKTFSVCDTFLSVSCPVVDADSSATAANLRGRRAPESGRVDRTVCEWGLSQVDARQVHCRDRGAAGE